LSFFLLIFKSNEIHKLAARRGLFASEYQRSSRNEADLISRPVWQIEDLNKSVLELRAEWARVRDEAQAMIELDERRLASNRSTDLSKLLFQRDEEEVELWRDQSAGGEWEWKQFTLYGSGGLKSDKKCARVPLTCRLIDKIESERNCSECRVKFSVLTMHANNRDKSFHVWPHCGTSNTKLRLHLTLKTPKQDLKCAMRIRTGEATKQMLEWREEGELLAFDDSFENEIWCNVTGDSSSRQSGAAKRVVVLALLIVDLWHPGLTPERRYQLL
jgi:aspartate beta-hydroxylase